MAHPYRTAAEGVTQLVERIIEENLPPPPQKMIGQYVFDPRDVAKILFGDVEPSIEVHPLFEEFIPAVAVTVRDANGKRYFVAQVRIRGFPGRSMVIDQLNVLREKVISVLKDDPRFSPWPYRRKHGVGE